MAKKNNGKTVEAEMGKLAVQVDRKENRGRYRALCEMGVVYNEYHLERTRNQASEYYAGVDPRRRREVADGGMVREDQNAMANLPRQAIHCEYPDRFAFRQNPYIDDTVLE
jgi:hypothetical protein